MSSDQFVEIRYVGKAPLYTVVETDAGYNVRGKGEKFNEFDTSFATAEEAQQAADKCARRERSRGW